MAYTTINKSSLHRNTTLITGNNSTQAFTGLGFAPDMIWTKKRNGSANHLLYDKIRGVGKYLYPNLNNAQGGNGTDSALSAFGTDGFTLNSGDDANGSGATGVAWSWKANGVGSSNTDGSINTTYTSVNTTAGFSISKYTGTGSNATVGHGLGAVPKMMIIKKIEHAKDWRIYHASVGNTKQLFLNDTGAPDTDNTIWNNTSPTSSVFTVGTNDGGNGVGNTYIAYCFAEKTGYSKFGSYTGNGNADGTFVYTGFKPAFLLIKVTSSVDSWRLFDNKRTTSFNPIDITLRPNTNDADYTASANNVDFLSNGFKMRTTSGGYNGSSDTIIYMAFGQSLVGSNNVPCTAR